MISRRSLLQSALAVGGVPRSSFDNDLARRVFSGINDLRRQRGAEALIWSDDLADCATEQSRRKVLLRFPGHNDPERGDVAQRLRTAGIEWMLCGENIFTEKGWDDPVNFAVVFWWYSPGHRNNLLNPEYTHTGVGLSQAADSTWYLTQIFTRPRPQR